MKYVYNILLILSTVFFFSCQENDELAGNSKIGYLRLTVANDASTTTRADVPENYNPKQIAVQILKSDGSVFKETDDFSKWGSEPIEIPAGNYTIKASSANWDGMAAEFDAPYYTGSTEVKILGDQEVNATVTCRLANVKVTVKYDEELLSKVKSIATVVRSEDRIYQQNFTSTQTKSAYYPVMPLVAEVTVVTDKGSNTMTEELGGEAGVQARDHFILNIHAEETGPSNITVSVDPTTHEYYYKFNISTVPSVGATLSANAWAKFAYLKAENIIAGSGMDISTLKFQYRVEGAGSWTDAAATKTTVEATEEGAEPTEVYNSEAITGLTSNTTYEYRMVNEDETFESSTYTFKTEEELQLQNAGFEDWYLLEAKLGFMGADSKTWYPCSQSYYTDNGASFWDSSNPGTTQDMGSMSGGLNPTQGTSEVKHGGTKAAKLETQWAILKLAAASIYTGKFNSLVGASGAKIDFGQPFVSRPISLKGWYQYAPGVIDDEKQEVGDSGVLKEGDTDQCSIYVILATSVHQVDNTNTSTLLTAENVWKDNTGKFIAYGELPVDQCGTTNGEWKSFDIPLQYKEGMFGVQPTHLIIVSSSSKYGDYFTGAVGSTLYLDDFSLNYEGTPAIWNFESGATEE